MLGGLCLANAKLGTVHGYAGVIGGMFETAPHGAICATLLPFVMRKNAEKLGVCWPVVGCCVFGLQAHPMLFAFCVCTCAAEKLKDEGDAVAAIR